MDGAKEFLATIVQNICKKFGVEFKVSDPYMHEQNGKIERVHLNIDSKVRVWLKKSGLPKSLWFMASKCAVYVINRTVTKALNFSKTPYEIKEGVKPSVKNFKIFGCKAYVHIPKEKRKKLDEQGIPAIFVGYSEKSSGYEFYDLITEKFFSAGSAIFDENSFPGHEMVDDYKEFLVNDDDFVNDDDYQNESDYDENEYLYENNSDDDVVVRRSVRFRDIEHQEEGKNDEVVNNGDVHGDFQSESENIGQSESENSENENNVDDDVSNEENQDNQDDPDFNEEENDIKENVDERNLRRSQRIKEQKEQQSQGVLKKFGWFMKMNGK